MPEDGNEVELTEVTLTLLLICWACLVRIPTTLSRRSLTSNDERMRNFSSKLASETSAMKSASFPACVNSVFDI
jgi:hypothetical protein